MSVQVHLFTDGACSGNPGPGGWSYILRHLATGKELEGSDGEEEALVILNRDNRDSTALWRELDRI